MTVVSPLSHREALQRLRLQALSLRRWNGTGANVLVGVRVFVTCVQKFVVRWGGERERERFPVL